MRRGLALALVTTLSCVSAPRGGANTEVCRWPEGWWDDQATLRVPGTTLKLGRARKFWSNGAWHGAFVSGSLQRSTRRVVFQGEWNAHGLRLDADLLVDEEPVFTVFTPTRLGPSAALSRGAPVRLLDARPGEVLVRPTERALDMLITPEPLLTTLRCEDLSLQRRASNDALGAVEGVGFRRVSERVRVKPNDVLLLTDAPDGGAFGAVAPGTVGFVVDKQRDAVRLAAVSDGVVLVGWVGAALVEPFAEVTLTPALDTVQPAQTTGLVWRECDEPVPLHVYDGEGLGARVGTVDRRRRIGTRLRTPVSKASVVVLESNWFEVDPNVTLLTPLDLSDCNSVIGPW